MLSQGREQVAIQFEVEFESGDTELKTYLTAPGQARPSRPTSPMLRGSKLVTPWSGNSSHRPVSVSGITQAAAERRL